MPFVDGGYYWPPVGPEIHGEVTQQQLLQDMDNFHQVAANWDYVISGAVPGFDDYPVAGTFHPTSFGHIAFDGDSTLRLTLSRAIEANPDVIQIITWNDYIEGTMIEPTQEFDTLFLEAIQDIRRTKIDPSFPYLPEDLRVPMRIFTLRKAHEDDEDINASLDRAIDLLFNDDLRSAVSIVQSLEAAE